MKARIKETTNKAFTYLIDKIGHLEIGRVIHIIYTNGEYFHTSSLKNIEYTKEDGESFLKVTTKNSSYLLELMEE